jgi:hypothetical protein
VFNPEVTLNLTLNLEFRVMHVFMKKECYDPDNVVMNKHEPMISELFNKWVVVSWRPSDRLR